MDDLNRLLWGQQKGLKNALSGESSKKGQRKPINKGLRNQVWLKYMGKKVSGKCFCCKINTIYFNEFQVGHDKAVAKGGKNHLSNLRPICGSCNRGMRTMSIEQYKRKHFGEGRKTRSDKGTKKAPKKSNNPFEVKIPQVKLRW